MTDIPNDNGGSANPGGEDDKVGYRRPPKKSQFKTGQSGNPRGRPRSMTDSKAEARKFMGELVIIEIDGRKRQVTRFNAMLFRLVDAAEKGDPKAAQVLLKFGVSLNLFNDTEDWSEYAAALF